MEKKTYIKPNLMSEKFIPQTYCASCNFTTYKLQCTVSGSENSDGDSKRCTHRSDACNNIEHQILTFDANGYLKIYEIENRYFTGADCTIITSPTDDTPRTWHKDQLKTGQIIYWKTAESYWECLHQGIVNLDPNNKGNLT